MFGTIRRMLPTSGTYDSAEQMILADIPIDGKQRKVLLHAPKNGFFYVIDRENGCADFREALHLY